MKSETITATSSLETKPLALFVQTASQFKSVIRVSIGNKVISGKSIMGMISLGILEGQDITISAEGEDEEKAVEGLINFIRSIN